MQRTRATKSELSWSQVERLLFQSYTLSVCIESEGYEVKVINWHKSAAFYTPSDWVQNEPGSEWTYIYVRGSGWFKLVHSYYYPQISRQVWARSMGVRNAGSVSVTRVQSWPIYKQRKRGVYKQRNCLYPNNKSEIYTIFNQIFDHFLEILFFGRQFFFIFRFLGSFMVNSGIIWLPLLIFDQNNDDFMHKTNFALLKLLILRCLYCL